ANRPCRREHRHRYLGRRPAAGASRVCAAGHSRPRLHLDARLLGMGSGLRRLLLGTWYLGDAATNRPVVDAWLVGLVGWLLSLARGLLGLARRLLRRRQLRLWLLRQRLLGWRVAGAQLLLQPGRQQ